MDITRDIDSLTHFKRNTNEVIEQLKATGQPMVLTVNGKAEIVVQDAVSYQAMLDLVDRAEAITGSDVRILHIRHAAREAFSAEDLAQDLSLPLPPSGRSETH
jgi:prevent-host-death family protein